MQFNCPPKADGFETGNGRSTCFVINANKQQAEKAAQK